MIPGLLAQDVARSLGEFIVTGFETDTWPFTGKFEQLVNTYNEGEAFIKGPYVSVNLPFAKKTTRTDLFDGFKTEHSPFEHQQLAWNNLKSAGLAKSTIVATGTGSGKTECFLYPMLDHCQRNTNPGIKAIVIYPMNALAGDQAKRFADVIHSTPELKGKVRVGLFVGGADNTDQKRMGENHVITCKKTLRESPPDILLTNYKMLDYLLMRPKDQSLWKHNQADTLKYLVVDELHTFDGAQGSDLAMLIRRLKARLDIKPNSLICAGTSATLGSESQMDDLASYASNIFDTSFDRNSIIGESRETHEEFLQRPSYLILDPSVTAEELLLENHADYNAYIARQAQLFFVEEEGRKVLTDIISEAGKVQLGKELRQHVLLHGLLFDLKTKPLTVNDLAASIRKQLPSHLKPHAEQVLISFLALLSHARGERYPGEPFVTVRLQLWARELRRIVARVGDDTVQSPVLLQFADDLKREVDEIYLPTVQCNECHTTAWLTSVDQGETHIEKDLRKIYNHFFSSDKQTRVLLPLKKPEHKPPMKGLVKHLCASCGHLQFEGETCKSCQEESLVLVFEPDLNKSVKRGGVPTFESQRMCPVCQAQSSLILFGSRAASLSSVAIHQMYADPINDDKKLIAFSDSVQDAAHRAGFFAARTWQNNIRMAIAKALTYHCKKSGEIALSDFYQMLPEFWLDNSENIEKLSSIDFITQFIPPNLQTHEDYFSLKENKKLDNPGNLINQISKRMIWETLSEFGIRSLIGRSLERTGIATISWDSKLIDDAASVLVGKAQEKLGYELSEKSAQFILWGISLRMKRQGAIYNEVLEGYIDNGGNYYILNMIPFLPKYQEFSTLPRFPAEAVEKGFDQLSPKKHESWYSRWVIHQLGVELLVDNNFVSDFLAEAMRSLIDSGLLISLQTKKENSVWALNPEHLVITNQLAAVHLRRGYEEQEEAVGTYGSWYLPSKWIDSIEGMPSLDQVFSKDQSSAVYEKELNPRRSMYKDFYIHGQIERVIAHEHTALLERDYREALEGRFLAKAKDRMSWYENLLSATPTLEMGIDIGDLSSVLLCSVPPAQANYLQRAGRSGRRDGNSFVLTLANGHPHDLYFYADPLKMIAGDVQAPAIFLNAAMVLKRQLLAFCFDQWGVEQAGNNVIPGKMQPVLEAVENSDQKKFPYTLLEFVSKNRDELWERFSSLLDNEVTEETRDKLKAYLLATSTEDDALHIYVLDRIKHIVEERKLLTKHQRELESELRALRKKPQDEARDETEKDLTTELEGIKRLKWDLNRKETLNFFTDDGLLPNYAFPEEGTTLRSVIYRRLSKPIQTEDGKTTNYDTKVFEYSRPAHAALSELAPESVFYASNRKVKIERIEMARGENLEYWCLCPSCSYSEKIIGADKGANCPRCKDPMWANVSQTMPMVRLQQVYANTREDDAQIGDDSDIREPTFYNRQMLIDFDPADISLAYAMKTNTRPFGFEFIKKANFKEINFGKQGGTDQVINVAGEERARPGFRICKECGMVQHRKNKTEHMFKCSYKAITAKEGEDKDLGIIECLYLYRQYESEAIRILMPKLSLDNRDQQIQSFVAAIQLGLKTRFGGKVDHIHITINDEPIPGSTERASYLVLYDAVPGGTGYLHTLLADPKNMMETLKLVQDVMSKCGCQEIPDLDGCYNCLYAYKNSYGMENTSRTTALGMLADILDENVELEQVSHLGKVSKNVWADSELESRFPDAVQALNQHKSVKGVRIRTTKDIINGKVGFKLEVGDLLYSVEPHVQLGAKEGVAYPCEPDFLISLDRASENAVKVAVFLDGYKYHKDIVHEDLLKRQGIFLSSDILVWSLTWHDVNYVFAGSEVKVPNVFRENIDNPPPAIAALADKNDLKDHNAVVEVSPLPMLINFLADPQIDRWQGYAMLRSFCWADKDRMQEHDEKEKFIQQAKKWPSQYTDNIDFDELIFTSSNEVTTPEYGLTTFISGSKNAITELDPNALVLATVFDSKNSDAEQTQRAWQKLLQIMNLGQFLPRFFAATQKGIVEGHFAQLRWGVEPTSIDESEWDHILQLADESLQGLIAELAGKGVDLPEVGYELVDDKGAGLAEAELAWESKKIALLMDYQMEEGKEAFVKAGWTVFELIEDMAALIGSLLGGQ